MVYQDDFRLNIDTAKHLHVRDLPPIVHVPLTFFAQTHLFRFSLRSCII